MSEITLDVGLAYKIKQALSRNSITDVADLDWLATGDNIGKVRRVRLGHAEITTPRKYSEVSMEEICRELLSAAVEDGLVTVAEGVRPPSELSIGDMLAVANRLNSFFMPSEPEHVIDCDVDPFVPDGWTIEEHQKGGAFKWNPANVALYLDKGQKDGKWIEGNKLRNELADKPVLNASALDYLLTYPHLIPEEWKGKPVFFWGTIYRDRRGYLLVRYLDWYGVMWDWEARWLYLDWNDNEPAAVPARLR